ncbi:O-antigen ligase family protein [bacterium]|nr:O-antigen ligase family protein [bacterium]
MKYALFSLALNFGVPLLTALYTIGGRFKIIIIFLFFICLTNDLNSKLSINIISHEWYRGSSRGLEITALDLIIISILLSELIQSKLFQARLRINWESLLSSFCLISALLSTVFAQVPLYAIFSFWKYLRGFVIYLVFRSIFKEEHIKTYVFYFSLMILYQTGFVLWQKYFLGIYRVVGTLPHMNSLAMLINIYTLPAFSLALSGFYPVFHTICVLCGVFIVISTASRGALVCLILGFLIVFFFKLLWGISVKSWLLLCVFSMVFLIGAYKSSDTLIDRFQNAPKESGETRHGFNDCAKLMGQNFVFGVGLNNFSYMMGHSKYGEKGPDLANGDKDDGVAHHIYWLTFAEQGFLGLIALVGLVLWSLLLALGIIIRSKSEINRAFAVGLFASLFTLHFQGFLEWILRQTNVWFLFCVIFGVLSSLSQERKSVKNL